MNCTQCGKENNLDDKFCRYCGSSLIEQSGNSKTEKYQAKQINLRTLLIVVVIALLIAGGSYAGLKVYTYFEVESKISEAVRLQSTEDYGGTLEILNEIKNETLTSKQDIRIADIESDNQKFVDFKTSFDKAIAIGKDSLVATTSLVFDLQAVLKDLQEIDSSYPRFKDVQVEISKIQNNLVTIAQNEATEAKKATEDAQTKAGESKAAADAAEANAAAERAAKIRAQQSVTDAINNTQAKVDEAKTAEVLKSFYNQLLAIYNNFTANCADNLTSGMKNYNDGDKTGASMYFGAALSACQNVQDEAEELNETFSNMPQNYVDAAAYMAWAAYYELQVIDKFLDQRDAEAEIDKAFDNATAVYNFLNS